MNIPGTKKDITKRKTQLNSTLKSLLNQRIFGMTYFSGHMHFSGVIWNRYSLTVSNNSTKRRQNGFKIGTRDKFATQLSYENFISNEIVFTHFFLRSAIFPYNSLYTQAVAYTAYFELGEPVVQSSPSSIYE